VVDATEGDDVVAGSVVVGSVVVGSVAADETVVGVALAFADVTDAGAAESGGDAAPFV